MKQRSDISLLKLHPDILQFLCTEFAVKFYHFGLKINSQQQSVHQLVTNNINISKEDNSSNSYNDKKQRH